MVTVELAFAALALAVVLAAAIVIIGAAFILGQCQVTANEVARQMARGDDHAVALAVTDAPAGASVDSRRDAGVVIVQVTWQAPIGPSGWTLAAEARVLEEP